MPSKSKRAKLNEFPDWYQPGATLGSAVRHVASLSSKFNWVGIYVLKGSGRKQVLELGPYIGAQTEHRRIPIGRGICETAISAETKSELVVLVRDRKGKVLGQIDIDSHTPAAFGLEEEAAVRKIADELGSLWQE